MTLSEKKLWLEFIADMIRLPSAKVRKHTVIVSALRTLEKCGWKCPDDLAAAVVADEDAHALTLLESAK